MNFDLPQTGIMLFFVALLGYVVGNYFDSGYLGSPFRPKGGDFERYLKYTAIGVVIIILTSLLAMVLFYQIIPTLAIILFPQVTADLLFALTIIYLLLLGLLVIVINLSPSFGQVIRFLKNKSNTIEITIETCDNNGSLVVREIYDENAEYFFFLDKNGNWGLIKKSLVNRITSERKKPPKPPKKIQKSISITERNTKNLTAWDSIKKRLGFV